MYNSKRKGAGSFSFLSFRCTLGLMCCGGAYDTRELRGEGVVAVVMMVEVGCAFHFVFVMANE